MENSTKIGIVFFSIGIFAVLFGLFLNLSVEMSGNEFLDPSVWHLIWGGVFFVIIGIVCLIPNSKDN